MRSRISRQSSEEEEKEGKELDPMVGMVSEQAPLGDAPTAYAACEQALKARTISIGKPRSQNIKLLTPDDAGRHEGTVVAH